MKSEDFVLSIGEQKSIKINSLSYFSVGNKEVISVKYLKRQSKFLIKARHLGFSDVIISNKGVKRKLNFYVFQRKRAQKLMDLINLLKEKNLDIKVHGNFVEMKGIVKDLQVYNLIHKYTLNDDYIINSLKLELSLKNQIIARIYKEIFPFINSPFNCNSQGIKINCYISSSTKKFKGLFKSLKKRYYVKFFEIPSDNELKNFKIKLKIIQVQGIGNLDLSSGLSEIMAQNKDIFERDLKGLIQNNFIKARNLNIDVETFAEPETVTRIGKESTIELGQEVAFETVNAQSVSSINWKFAGLKIKLKLLNDLGNLILNYTTELSTPIDRGVSGSKEASSINVSTDKSYLMFRIKIKSIALETGNIPWISKIPLIGSLFKSKSKQNSTKSLYAFLKIEELK